MYFDYFPGFFIGSTLFGASLGLANISQGSIRTGSAFFVVSIWTGIGMIMGITYPVSYPSVAVFAIAQLPYSISIL